MDKDLKKLIGEMINETFENAPEKLVERGIREIQYDICPHCKQEIHEKHDYTEDGGVTWRHSDCKGLISRPETPMEKVAEWLRPYVKEARENRHKARKKLDMSENVVGLPPSGEEKYKTQEPGGTMSAVNTEGTVKGAEKKEETKPVRIGDYEQFYNGMMRFVNATGVPLKVTITEFKVMADEVHSVSSYIVRVENG